MVESAQQSDESPDAGDGIEDLPEIEALEEVTEPGLGTAARTTAPPPIPPQARQSRAPASLDSPNRLPSLLGGSEPAYAYRSLPPPPQPAGARTPGSAPPSSGVYVIDPRALPPLPLARGSSAVPGAIPAPGASFSAASRDDATQPRYQPDAHRLEVRIRELEAKLRLRDDLITELERSLKEQRRRAVEADAELQRLREAASVSEDLKRIRGIGPGFERKLHALGITRFEQVAAWSASDVAAIADRLGIQALRIERDGWVASAQALLDAR